MSKLGMKHERFLLNGAHVYKTHLRSYEAWRQMMRRCYDKRCAAYGLYGARGICVDPRWHSFALFYADMGEPTAGFSLDRINNGGPYALENCRWADLITQCNNKRSNRLITYLGETMTVSQWARRIGIKPETLFRRLQSKKSPQSVLSELSV
jgi:hypothetical protein